MYFSVEKKVGKFSFIKITCIFSMTHSEKPTKIWKKYIFLNVRIKLPVFLLLYSGGWKGSRLFLGMKKILYLFFCSKFISYMRQPAIKKYRTLFLALALSDINSSLVWAFAGVNKMLNLEECWWFELLMKMFWNLNEGLILESCRDYPKFVHFSNDF